ncbi:MAG: sialidase family protein, partial [Chloroflexota bacterium]
LGLVYAESKDDGKTWVCGKINVPGADPDIVMLPDGKLRLYFVEFPFGPNPLPPGSAQSNQPNRVKSALSVDGKTFTIEEGVRIAGVGYTDPDVIRVGNDWLMYISTGAIAWAAQSSDGLAFKLIGKVNETGAVSGSFVFPNGTIRHYFCGRGGIMSATSADGKSAWKEESGARLAPNPAWKIVCDPSILSDGKRGYWMVYKIQPK